MMRAREPPAEGLEGLADYITRLEADIDSFSAALARLSDAQKVISRQRPLAGSRTTARGTLYDLQQLRRTDDESATLSLGVGLSRTEGLSGSPTGSLGSLCAIAVIAGIATACCVWAMCQKKSLSEAKPHSTAHAATFKTGHRKRINRLPCDVAFLAHPASLLSALAFWLPEDRPMERWRASWWMLPAWPFVALASVWYMFLLPRLRGPYLVTDSFECMGAHNQTWLSRAFGYQFMIKALRPRIARGIEAAVREADKIGISVLGLGALNKAEFINRGGEDILNSFQPKKTRLVHGNTLTAAVVVENVKAAAAAIPEAKRSDTSGRCVARPPSVFLTGATSKVGRAVALKLALDGYDVVCCTSSDERFNYLQQELELLKREPATFSCSNRNGTFFSGHNRSEARCEDQSSRLDTRNGNVEVGKSFPLAEVTGFAIHGKGSSGRGKLLRASRLDEGVHYRLWVVGKYDASARVHIPLGASAVVFAVPCPLEGHRPDVSAVPGGIVRMDVSRCSPRRFHILLPFDQLYACHAAALVHHYMNWTHHEVGKVDIGRMASTLKAARECGFSIAFCRDQLTTAVAVAAAAAAAAAPPSVGDEALDIERGYSPTEVIGLGEAGWSTKVRVGTGRAPSSTATARCSGFAENDVEQRGESVSLPRPEAVLHDGNSSPGVVGSSGLAAATENRDCVTGVSKTSGKGCRRRDVRDGGEEDVSAIAASISTKTGAVVEVSGFGGAVPCTLKARRDGTTVAEEGEAASRKGEDVELSEMPPAHAERFPAAGKEEEDARKFVDISASGEDQSSTSFCRVVVVGAGASGLSAAACLRVQGEAGVLILERSDSVCGAWGGQYEGLQITTRRTHCGLPGWPVPREGFSAAGSSDISAPSFVRYLRGYRRRFDLDVSFETEVIWAERESVPTQGPGGTPVAGCIRVQFRRGGSISVIRCEHLVIATGKNAIPRMPPEVVQSLQGFSGEVIHSSRVKDLAARARGWGVCIVGMGNSACDLAVALLDHGAEKVHISTRSVPPIIMRQWGPLSLEWMARAVQYLPPRANDFILAMFAAAKWGKGWRETVFPPQLEQTWSPCTDGRVPCIDKGRLMPALQDGRITVRGPIDWANGHSLRFRHSGAVGPFETVILATGFDSAHESWLHPRLLEEGAGGVHMVGFNNGRALLPLRQIGADSRRAAARIAPRRLPGMFTRIRSWNGRKIKTKGVKKASP